MATPHEILDRVRLTGVISKGDIEQLQEHMEADWVIDQAEAEFLFSVNAQLVKPSESWSLFFAECVSKFVLFDMDTPGEIDTNESEWLRTHLSDPPSASERQLLLEIKKLAVRSCDPFVALLESL